eukprot:1137683-Pelagomonas_calceolata.AAC.2
MDNGSADRLPLQNLQIPGHSTNRTFPKYIFPRHFPDKQRLTSSPPDAILFVPMKRVPMTDSRYLLRSRGGRRGNREHSAPATATPPTCKRHVHLVEVKYREDTRPKNQLEASKQQHRDLCHHLSRGSAQVNLHTILLGVGGVIYTPHTLEPLKELVLDSHTVIKLVLKPHAHSAQYAHKLVSTRCAFGKTSFNSQARATASNPPDPH